MYIQYRLFSEHSLWRLLEINKNENYILASDLKHIICKQSNINYNNKIDIYFSVYKEDGEENGMSRVSGVDEEVAFLNAEDKIYNGTKILIHRHIKKKSNVSDITHEAKKEISVDVREEQKINIPSEFLCKLCSYILIDSHIVVCSNNCGYSVCKTCILFYILNQLVVQDEKKMCAVIDLSKLKENSIQCPLCNGSLKYCIWNKKLELTLKKIIDERSDIDSFKLNVEERNSRFLRIVEKLKIENFPPSGSGAKENIFETEIFKAIEDKYILSGANKKTDEPSREEEVKIPNHFLYLMTNNRLNCTKEFNMIFLDFENPIFDTVQKMSLRAVYDQHLGKTNTGQAASSVSGDDNRIDGEGKRTITQSTTNQILHTDANVGRKVLMENNEDDLDEDMYNQNKTYVMPISFVGGETSYSLIGVFYVKDLFKRLSSLRTGTEDSKEEDILKTFLQKWFSDEVKPNQNSSQILNPLERLKSGDVYTLEWVHKYEKTCFFPARKQPIYNIINSRRQRSRKKNNIEIVLDLKKFLDVVLSVNNYIKYGSRPNNYETKKGVGPQGVLSSNVDDEEGKRKMAPTSIDNKLGDPSSWLHSMGNVDVKGNPNEVTRERLAMLTTPGEVSSPSASGGLIKQSAFQDIFQIMYDTKIPPVTTGSSFNVNNPYAEYCALLPFLTKEDFLFLRKLQRIYKEKYLRQLYRHVRRNNLSMNIFFNAVNSVFFSSPRWQS
ncbi:conserved Plasmodium protein, unknown function [Plasmodium knowlesi strain H]|uniref:RING-type domain-containing protein n=3 Tax=Plasmodium knowlesi TaxID=5850 RepID=A0A5K1TW38_PLAKH|nr:conserved protein, unknown function [Plasmodium knowlesi strain H]OTN66459.1 Uncharacterized protein PKNOH_S09520000 [Plasmodium knowlesi]CAA9986368.1 conserved protein, unknown function [Plasmodium knowlesi strain H]SBO25631.1 conserved Plasmodium protein, unknown function [Plasmodium knowlesi strain H]SBO28354.1 conserved Plasmodium protein, unknown function [Plasmodium knowlesi strain H]VVS75842.1 conserved protein, unknown function [Plasmodium knowlesi strain H]|eukprot:XP_002257774.1 hypothetical protein, conserved in Plasmodium species [Plasmodium knowlesi strain H]